MTADEDPAARMRARFAEIAAELPPGRDEFREWWEEMRAQGRAFTLRELLRIRRRGRPRGVRNVSRDELLTAYRKLRAELDRRPKQRELGLRLHAKPRQIRQWLTDFELRWPPE